MTRSGQAALSSQRMRQRKLNTRSALKILSENQLQEADDDIQRIVSTVDTGVEKGEVNASLPSS